VNEISRLKYFLLPNNFVMWSPSRVVLSYFATNGSLVDITRPLSRAHFLVTKIMESAVMSLILSPTTKSYPLFCHFSFDSVPETGENIIINLGQD